MPLVPRDGRGYLLGRGGRPSAPAAFRGGQGRPRREPRGRPTLPAPGQRADRRGRMATHRIPHARRRSVPWRHLLSANRRPRATGVPSGSSRRSRDSGRTSPSESARTPRRSGTRWTEVESGASRPRRRSPISWAVCARPCTSPYDPVNGGFGMAPKFPHPTAISFLLWDSYANGTVQSADRANETLARMADGGVYDQVGGGFHRYSVDEGWHIPHFEKMGVDNAALLATYVEGAQRFGEARLDETVRGILAWVREALQDPPGGSGRARTPTTHRETTGTTSLGPAESSRRSSRAMTSVSQRAFSAWAPTVVCITTRSATCSSACFHRTKRRRASPWWAARPPRWPGSVARLRDTRPTPDADGGPGALRGHQRTVHRRARAGQGLHARPPRDRRCVPRHRPISPGGVPPRGKGWHIGSTRPGRRGSASSRTRSPSPTDSSSSRARPRTRSMSRRRSTSSNWSIASFRGEDGILRDIAPRLYDGTALGALSEPSYPLEDSPHLSANASAAMTFLRSLRSDQGRPLARESERAPSADRGPDRLGRTVRVRFGARRGPRSHRARDRRGRRRRPPRGGTLPGRAASVAPQRLGVPRGATGPVLAPR